jgi:hypothetical protein
VWSFPPHYEGTSTPHHIRGYRNACAIYIPTLAFSPVNKLYPTEFVAFSASPCSLFIHSTHGPHEKRAGTQRNCALRIIWINLLQIGQPNTKVKFLNVQQQLLFTWFLMRSFLAELFVSMFFFIPTFISNQKFTIYKLICCGVQ